ncbi:PREDICTED: uncharacterized protein LOC105003627, partial [Bison bison bison]|uniref:Glypican-1 n=1 Tax=Bison bison bison TaxID=43346 RepID=A0A6P3J3N5_BISBB
MFLFTPGPDSMVLITDKFWGPSGAESVVGGVHYWLAEAINALQDNSDTLTAKVIQGCGNPKVNPQGPGAEEKWPRGKLALQERPPAGTLQKLQVCAVGVPGMLGRWGAGHVQETSRYQFLPSSLRDTLEAAAWGPSVIPPSGAASPASYRVWAPDPSQRLQQRHEPLMVEYDTRHLDLRDGFRASDPWGSLPSCFRGFFMNIIGYMFPVGKEGTELACSGARPPRAPPATRLLAGPSACSPVCPPSSPTVLMTDSEGHRGPALCSRPRSPWDTAPSA